MRTTRHPFALAVCFFVATLCLMPVGAAPPPSTAPDACPATPYCGESCHNEPFKVSKCWTTAYGPARANVLIAASKTSPSPNMLWCPSGAYALCFFSGPSTPTGNPGFDNPALPCVLDGDVASCTCQAYADGPYYVDINAIINLGAWYQVTNANECGADGSGCKNMRDCDAKGEGPSCPEKIAPVCNYVEAQKADDPTFSLVPGADLISTYSFAMSSTGAYSLDSVDCEGTYAGCMTAPCTLPAGTQPPTPDGPPVQVQCACPTYTGNYQVGQPISTDQCTPAASGGKTYVWSAARTVAQGS